jgi:hypothetical protein
MHVLVERDSIKRDLETHQVKTTDLQGRLQDAEDRLQEIPALQESVNTLRTGQSCNMLSLTVPWLNALFRSTTISA